MKHLTTLFLFSLFTITAFAQTNVGEEAPDFELQVLGEREGTYVVLSELEGKVVYIFFYGASCPHCIENGPVTESEIYSSFKEDTNFVALGLDTWNQNASANNSFKSSTGITYPLLLNAQSTLVNYYGGSSFYDRSVVVGADGILRYKGNGYVDTDYEDVIESITEELAKISTSSESDRTIPSSVILNQNYPNPFNPSTVISYHLPEANNVRLEVFDMIGHKVATLVNERQSSGEKTAVFDASSLSSGVYLYRLQVGSEIVSRKMMLIK
jgi:peroxiredoxin